MHISNKVITVNSRFSKRIFLALMFGLLKVSASMVFATEGSCMLKIIAANDLARTASIYVDDKLAGTLESGELVVFDMDVGPHLITLDGELLEMHTLEVFFQNTFEAKQLELNANPAKRAVRIISEPSSAAIRLDNGWLEQTTPWQIILDVGKTYEIELFKELYGSKTQSLYIPDKGEIIVIDIEIPKADFPNKPLLLYPEDKSIHLEERVVELAWESLDDSLQYEIEFDGKVHKTSNNIARFYSLERGKTYFWRVTAVNRYGMRATSEQYSFTTQPNRLPEITSVYPQNESSDVFADVITLTWEVTDADGDSITYDVYFGDALDSLEKVRSKTNSNEHITQELERGKSYYWKIVLTDSYGEVNESSVYSFATMPNRPPIEPFNIIPENGMDNLPDFLTLEWDCTDPDNDNLTYTVYLGADKDFMKQMGETNKKKFVLNDLTRGTTYYWKIAAFDSFGAKVEGPLNTFTIKANISPVIDPNSEILLKETDRDVLAELEWFSVDPDNDHLVYDVYFGTDKEPSLILADCNQTTWIKENLNFGTTYYWQISANDQHGGISKGPMWEFTTNDPPIYIPSDFVPEMVLVEKGSFATGDTDEYSNEKPTHSVTFTYDFYIGKYEVTFDEYDAFCEATGRSKLSDKGWGRGNRPVIWISWWNAIAYCNWLSEKEELPKAYDNNWDFLDKDGIVTTDITKVLGYRLPTEAEWEYAARGGNKSKGYKYSGSDNVDDIAWYSLNSGNKTQEVGKKAPNELGIYDMSGNVKEWCSDLYGDYSGSAQTNPGIGVSRGGSWANNEILARVADRLTQWRGNILDSVGFRITRTVP